MVRLRRECTEAKEGLSADTEATIPVLLPDVHTRVRLMRAEFEDFIHDAVAETVDALRAAIDSAGLAVGDVGRAARGRFVEDPARRPTCLRTA